MDNYIYFSMKSSELHKIAAGLNIEGGDPRLRLEKDHVEGSNFLWANLILVLDRPLVDGVIFEEIWNDNRYPLLENRIDELNEHHFMAAFLMILQYYVKNGHQMLNRSKDSKLKITVHLHQDPSRRELCNILDMHLRHLCKLMGGTPDQVELEYLTEDNAETFFVGTKTDYSKTDILVSLSQCAGFLPEYPPGTLHLADTFIPFSAASNVIDTTKEYKVDNDLMGRIDDILKSEFNSRSVGHVNSLYKSYNPKKSDDKARLLTKADFVETKILQVHGIWNPTNGDQLVTIK